MRTVGSVEMSLVARNNLRILTLRERGRREKFCYFKRTHGPGVPWD